MKTFHYISPGVEILVYSTSSAILSVSGIEGLTDSDAIDYDDEDLFGQD